MLSMLSDGMGSVPVGAIRGLVEVAWRALCMHADSVALGDVLEVVARIDRWATQCHAMKIYIL